MFEKIELTNDKGDPLGISLVSPDGDALLVRGLYFSWMFWLPRVFWSFPEVVLWSAGVLIKAAELEHKNIHKMRVGWRTLSTRDAVRLAFAAHQIIFGGVRYFSQQRLTKTGACVLPEEARCPHVEVRVEASSEEEEEVLLETYMASLYWNPK